VIVHVAAEPSKGQQVCARCGHVLIVWVEAYGNSRFSPDPHAPPVTKNDRRWFFRTGALVAHEDGSMMRVDAGEVDAPDCEPMEVDGVDIT